MYFMRDIVTLLAKIVLNIVSIRIIRKYFNKIGLQVALNSTIAEILRRESLQDTKTYMTKVDRNLAFISIIMCLSSSIENLFYIAAYIYIYFRYDEITSFLFFFSHLSLALKQFLNVIIIYSFNSQFKNDFKKYIERLIE